MVAPACFKAVNADCRQGLKGIKRMNAQGKWVCWRRGAGAVAAPVGVVAAMVAMLAGCSGPTSEELVASGKGYLQRGEPKPAIIDFKSALEQSPDKLSTRYLLAEALFQSGDIRSSALELRKALDGGFPKAEIAALYSRVLVAQNEPGRAIELFGDVKAATEAAQVELDTSLTLALAMTGDMANAQSRLDRALARQPDAVPALIVKARLLLRENKTDTALGLLDEILGRQPAAVEAR